MKDYQYHVNVKGIHLHKQNREKTDSNRMMMGGESTNCGLDTYTIVHEMSSFVDVQSIKVQELPEDVPVGELPKHVILSLEK